MPRPIARMLASRLSCVSSTPFGRPVLPDVYWMKAASAPFDSGVVTAAPRPASSPAVVTRRSVGTAGFRMPATPRARSIVISERTSAFARMALWRSAYSSSRSSRTGG